MGTTLIVDGDVCLYGSCPNRWGQSYNQLIALGKEPPVFTEEENVTYLALCVQNFKKIISQLAETTFADSVMIAMKGDNNFRNVIHPEYKAHRTRVIRPVNEFVMILREYAINHMGAIPAHGMEADDLVRIWHGEETAKGNVPVIASIDKDLLCIPGLHYRFKKGGMPAEGSRDSSLLIRQNEWDALKHYYTQLLMGDSTDNIPGLPRVGKERAKSILERCEDEEDLQFMTIYAYKEIIGKNWKKALILTGKLVTILPYHGFEFSIDGWKGDDSFKKPLSIVVQPEPISVVTPPVSLAPIAVDGGVRPGEMVMFVAGEGVGKPTVPMVKTPYVMARKF